MQYTKALLHFTDEFNPLRDKCGNTWISNKIPVLTANNIKFNKGLLLSNGQYLKLSNITLGGKDFTVDFWCYIGNSTYRYADILSIWSGDKNRPKANDCIGINRYETSNKIYLYSLKNRTHVSGSPVISPDNIQVIDSLIHIAMIYQHSISKLKFYINGTYIGASNVSIEQQIYDNFCIGWDGSSYYPYSANYYWLIGTIDEFRLSDGIARWTSNFTPPNTQYRISDQKLYLNKNKSINLFETKDSNKNIATSYRNYDLFGNPENIIKILR